MNTPRALVLRAPGINCDRETAQACRLAGFETELVHINQLVQYPETDQKNEKKPGRLPPLITPSDAPHSTRMNPKRSSGFALGRAPASHYLLDYHLLVIPGGFSYGDDLGAGTLLAKNLTIHLGSQLQQFISEGRLVLGICNGFQVLVRARLLPGYLSDEPSTGSVAASLTDNASAQFECRWVTLATPPSRCIFTRGIEHPIELPVAHGEGQFVLAATGQLAQLQHNGQIALVYAGRDQQNVPYPANPNGSIGNIAGLCNARGNVFGLMPHPERYVHALQHPRRRGPADGLFIFNNAYAYAKTLVTDVQEPRAAAPRAIPVVAASYADSGVDIAAADHAKELMKEAVRATQGPAVLAGMGAFAGVLDVSSMQHMRRPALVASTDGVGTKTLLAAQARRFETIGHDLVNHSVNDLLAQGARPLFFMDYLAMGRLDAVQAAKIVQSVAQACQEVGCALLGGETAEMPDVYQPGAFDLAGTIVGILEQDTLVNGAHICAGDVVLGLPSSGLHTNGYSLARRIFAPYSLDTIFPELGEPLVDALLRPHRCYLREIHVLQEQAHIPIKGMAHITGGGFAGNIARILPAGTGAVIETQSWCVPPLFQLLTRLGHVTHEESYRTLNMGIGMALVISPEEVQQALQAVPELLTIGIITNGSGVTLR